MGEIHLPITGGCLCGAIRYEANEEPYHVSYCHCDMCKRAFGGPFGIFVCFRKQAFNFVRGAPNLYQSSPDAERGFCVQCGTPLLMQILEGTLQGESESVRAKKFHPGTLRSQCITVSIGSLDHPENFHPMEHDFTDRQLPWLKIDDDLPRSDIDVGGDDVNA